MPQRSNEVSVRASSTTNLLKEQFEKQNSKLWLRYFELILAASKSSKKAFLKYQQGSLNANKKLSRLAMKKLCICFKSQVISAFDWWQREHSTTYQSFFMEGKRENVRFFKNDTPIHSEISSNVTLFEASVAFFFDSEMF